MRLRHYLAERARTPGIDFEIINGLNTGHEREAMLVTSDLVTVLDALGDLAAVPAPPYGEGDDVSFLVAHNWHVGKIISVTEVRPGEWEVIAKVNEMTVTRTVNAQGVGGGLAPLRQH